MSISLAVQFQQNLHKLLERDAELKRVVANVYQVVKANPKYPYILQHINGVKLQNTISLATYEITGEINIYARDNSFNEFKTIIHFIEKLFAKGGELISGYNYISSKIIEAQFIPSEDQLTTRLKLTYLALIQAREVI